MHYDKHIFICENQRGPGERPSCAHINSEILKYLKLHTKKWADAQIELGENKPKIRVQRAGCLDRCEEGPILVSYPEGKWFSIRNLVDAERFLRSYIANGDLESIKDLEIT
jgi:(2Fe-2S) ferredoxin